MSLLEVEGCDEVLGTLFTGDKMGMIFVAAKKTPIR